MIAKGLDFPGELVGVVNATLINLPDFVPGATSSWWPGWWVGTAGRG